MRLLRLLLWVLALLPAVAASQQRIENTATLHYAAADGGVRSLPSNTVTLTTERQRQASRITLRALPPGIDLAPTGCAPGSPPTLGAAPVTPGQLAAAPSLDSFDPEAGLVIVVDAPGSNMDPARAETITITIAGPNANVAVTLTETDVASGVFAGAIPPMGGRADLAPCQPAYGRGDQITLNFAGDTGSLPSRLAALIDPSGIVFDSADGTPVDGAQVTLLDAAGQPAIVLGDDGTSRYPATVISGTAATDASGRSYPVDHGGYRFPLVPAGRYHLKIVPPGGYTAPSQAAPAALALLRDAMGHPYLLSAASTGGELVVAGSDAVLTDIPLDRSVATTLLLSQIASVRDASPGDVVELKLLLTNRGTVATGPLHLTDLLPRGLRYRAGTVRGGTIGVVGDGSSLDILLASLAPGASLDIHFLVTVAPDAPIGDAAAHGIARGPGLASNEASAGVRIRALLFTDALTIIGRVSIGECGLPPRDRQGAAGVRLLLDDGTVALTDRDGLYHLEGVTPGRHVVGLDTNSLAGLEPIDCAADTRSAGSATSRFVEGMGGLVRRVDFQLRRDPKALAVAATPTLPIAPLSASAAAGDRDWLAGQTPGIAWLFPAIDYNPRAPVTRVAIKHLPGQRVALTLEGKPIDPLSFDATDSNAQGIAVSRWVGIPLVPGANHLAARILVADGQVVATLERTVTVSGAPHTATLDVARSRLVADGATTPLIAVRVVDADGRPVHAGTAIGFAVASPHVAAEDAALAQRRQTARGPAAAASTQVVGDDGLAFIALQPTGQAGAAHVTLALDDGHAERPVPIEAWLVAAAKAWTVIGFGAGSIGHDLLSRHARTMANGERGGMVTDGELSLYAKGRIKGAWLLTLAYDSARRRDDTRGLLGIVDPNRYYTVYGDTAVQGADAATQRKLYLRLETPTFYALFGDAETGLTDARLTRYQRTVEGFKAGYRGKHWQATAFAARPDTIAGRDEIQGNGLTGPYRLRAQHVVPNTDRVRIEVRDRLRSEVIVSTTPLTRHLDYDIDPDAGTLRFATPVLSRDTAGDPIVIVAEYEVEGGRAAMVAGGRVARRFGERVEIGAAGIVDNTLGNGRVVGADARFALDAATVLRGEYAKGGWQGLSSGDAFLAEAEHRGTRLDWSAYVREQATSFGLGQQNLSEAGTRKIGGDLRWRLGDSLVASVTGWHQRMLDGPGERTAGEARIDWTRGTRTLYAGAQIADDTGLDGGDRHSRLLTLGARQVLAGGALTLEGRADIAPGGESASVDFPARRQLTATWRITPTIRVIGGYEIDAGATYTAHTARVGVDLTPWRGATLSGAVNGQAVDGGGSRQFVQYGLGQSLPVGAHWSLDATLDSARTVSGAIAPGAMVNAFQPVAAAGQIGSDAGDYSSATFGVGYRGARWSGRGRLEYRDGANDTRWGLTLDALRAIGEGRTIAAGWRSYRVTDRAGNRASDITADLALAWRPPASNWSLLDRLTFRHEHGNPAASAAGGVTLGTSLVGTLSSSDIGGLATGQVTTRAVNNLALDWRSNPDGRGTGLEVSLYYGAKYVRGRYDDEIASGFVDATAFELRRDLGHRFDIGVAASAEHGWTDRVWAWSGGPSVGVSPAGDLWISAGYNVAGYRDRDFSADRYTHRGPYLTMRVKFDARRLASLLGRKP